MTNFHTLARWGWAPFFQQQLTLDEWETTIVVRVTQQHRSQLTVVSDSGEITLPLLPDYPPIVVGDWLLLDPSHRLLRLLDRSSCFRRKAAGTRTQWQLIAANVDTAFIVCSMNEDFNLNRIERYLSLVHASRAEPVIILTKSDLAGKPDQWISDVRQLDPALAVVAVNALDDNCNKLLTAWLTKGKTIAVLGSSGVGKSTLVNTLMGHALQRTNAIRADDDKGRHTTTGRSLLCLPSGALILDTPGMRELQLADAQEGVSTTFSDIEALASGCRFKNCTHTSEPDCAVLHAVAQGQIDHRRVANYIKLMREEIANSATLAQKRASEKSFTKFVKNSLKASQKFKGR